MKRLFIVFFSLFLLMLGWTLPAAANTINFDSLSGQPQVTNGYGNTSDVTVSYQTVDSSGVVVSGGGGQLPLFIPALFQNYGDLGIVALVYGGTGIPAGGHYGEITLTPSPGFLVNLQSFDVAPFVGTSPTNQLFTILDQNGTTLVQYTNQTVSTGTHVTYSPAITSNGALTLKFGPSGNIGINNIVFTSRKVYLPFLLLLLGSGS